MLSPNKAVRITQVLPDDVKAALEAAVKAHVTQVAVAKLLAVSPAVITTLLRDSYTGNVASMADRIRGKFMKHMVRCPVMGDLGRHDCLTYQARPLAATNPLRARLFTACKTCPNGKGTL